jgi:hypothetical protein
MVAMIVLDFQLSPVLGTDQNDLSDCSLSNYEERLSSMRAKYKLSGRRTLSYIQEDSWTGRLTWEEDVYAILGPIMLHAI